MKGSPNLIAALHQGLYRLLPDFVVVFLFISHGRKFFVKLAVYLSDLLALISIQLELALPKKWIVQYVPFICLILSVCYNGRTNKNAEANEL